MYKYVIIFSIIQQKTDKTNGFFPFCGFTRIFYLLLNNTIKIDMDKSSEKNLVWQPILKTNRLGKLGN